jgi:hypothetical protein
VRERRVPWWLRTGALFAIIGVLRLARAVLARWEPVCLLAGTLLITVGVVLPAVAAFFAGLLVLIVTLLRGIASSAARSRPD